METKTLAALYNHSFRDNWEGEAFSDWEGSTLRFKDVAEIIKSLHLFYQLCGIQKGDKIAVLGRNAAHWGSVFLSALSEDLVIVPILPDFSLENTNHIVTHSESKILIGSRSLLDKVDFDKAPELQCMVVLEDFSLFKTKDKNIEFKLADAFQHYRDNPLTKEGFAFKEREPEDCCIISYTSGTAGFTKGVMIPARSLRSNIIYAQDHMPLKPGDSIVSFLPLAHVYGLLFEFLFPVTLGCHITFLNKIPSPAILIKVFGEIKPHLILSVPLIIEKIYKKQILPVIEKPLMRVLLSIPGLSNLILNKIRAKLMETFGGRFFEIVIGGAPLSADVEKFFKRIKFPITIGYGMTECGPLISYEAWNKTMPTSAGRLVDRMELRIASEDPYAVVGEIQVKGENVMLGYFKNEKATKEVFTKDAWLKTGDLGITDANNFVYIKGRKKNMLLGPSGQNIYPEEIEAKLTNTHYVAECVVTKRDGKMIALVYPDYEALKANGLGEPDLPSLMEENKKKLNAQLPKYEQISRIELVKEEFEKTPKKNIRRYKYV